MRTATDITVKAVRTLTYRGYVRELHINNGDTIIIAKGIHLGTTHPQKRLRSRLARKTYKVAVNHTLPGKSITVGYVYDDGPQWSGQTESDLIYYCQALGIPTLGQRRAAIRELYSRAIEMDDGYGHGNKVLKVAIQNPQVCWAGSGGYWVWADINDVRLAK